MIYLTVGTRPDLIKMAPLIRAMPKATVLHTGQHWDSAMDGDICREFGIKVDHRFTFDDPDQTLGQKFAAMVNQTRYIITDHHTVVVYGDTLSALAVATGAKVAGAQVVHVEAGLRSGNLSMPEEVTRITIDSVADLLCCPTQQAFDNLSYEKVGGRCLVTGNLISDSLALLDVKRSLKTSGILCTLHRRENEDMLFEILQFVEKLGRSLFGLVEMPIHPRTQPWVHDWISKNSLFFKALPPLPYPEFIRKMAQAQVVVTDSGGVQEECAILGVPCVTIRSTTERPETVASGWNMLIDPAELNNRIFLNIIDKHIHRTDRELLSYGSNIAQHIAGLISEQG